MYGKGRVKAGVRSPFDVGRSQAMQWSTETIRQFQKEDPIISKLMDMVSKGSRPERPLLSLENREMRRLLKLSPNWDGPFTVARIVSESTVVIKSKIGRLYKSNVARLRRWHGDERAHSNIHDDSASTGVTHRATTGTKKGPGRPRKVGGDRPPLKKKSSNSNPQAQKKQVGRPKKISEEGIIRKVST